MAQKENLRLCKRNEIHFQNDSQSQYEKFLHWIQLHGTDKPSLHNVSFRLLAMLILNQI